MPKSFVMAAFNKCVETFHILLRRHTTEEIETNSSKGEVKSTTATFKPVLELERAGAAISIQFIFGT